MDHILDALWDVIQDRKAHPRADSYTASLFAKGEKEILKKLGEEAVEIVVAGLAENNERVIYESADLVYHLLVFLAARDLRWNDVEEELTRRFADRIRKERNS